MSYIFSYAPKVAMTVLLSLCLCGNSWSQSVDGGLDPLSVLKEYNKRKAEKLQKQRQQQRAKSRARAEAERKRRAALAAANAKKRDISKNPDARRIIIYGDSMAGFLARGLENAFSNNPDIIIENVSQAGISLLSAKVPALFVPGQNRKEKNSADILVLMTGLNDIHQMKREKNVYKFADNDWLTRYNQRLDKLIEPFLLAKKPIIWVNLPPIRNKKQRGRIAQLNNIHEQFLSDRQLAAIERVDIWDAFFNEDGKYSDIGLDIDGQVKKLRLKNGIGFTLKGREKLSFFVVNEIVRLLRQTPEKEVQKADIVDLQQAPGWQMNVPIKLNPGSFETADNKGLESHKPWIFSPEFDLKILGQSPRKIEARIDNYRWLDIEAQGDEVRP